MRKHTSVSDCAQAGKEQALGIAAAQVKMNQASMDHTTYTPATPTAVTRHLERRGAAADDAPEATDGGAP